MRFTLSSILLLTPTTILAYNASPATTETTNPSLQTLSSNEAPNTALQSPSQTLAPTTLLPLSDHEALQELRRRQNAGQVAGAAAAAVPTQVSPVTTYMIYGPGGAQTPVAYTQLFSAVPDQWPGPGQGSIGLGTIQGQVGVVKTKTKRDIIPRATDVIAGLVKKSDMEKRKKGRGGSSNSGTSGAGTISIPVSAVVGLLGMGVMMAMM